MFLTILLIIAGFLVAFINSSPVLVKSGSRLESLKNSLDSLAVPIGLTCGIIAIANAFNFWTLHYHLLTWLAVLINSIILTRDFLLGRLNIAEGPLTSILEFFVKYRIIFGFTLLVFCVIHIISLLSPFFDSILL